MCSRQTLRISVVATALAVLLAGNAAIAEILTTKCTAASNCKSGTGTWTWDLAPEAESADATCDGIKWGMTPNSPAGTKPKTLTIDLIHLVKCHNQQAEIPLNPPTILVKTAGTFGDGSQKAGYFNIKHPSLRNHEDNYVWLVVVSQGGAGMIKTKAKHTSTGLIPKYSYDPKNTTVKLTVIATYPTDADETVYDKERHGRKEGTLPKSTNKKEEPSDVHIRVQRNPTTDTTLAFIEGEPGSFGLGDLATMTEFFQDGRWYFAPKLFELSEAQDLFVAVDLVQWLTFGTAFNDGDIYRITAGENSSLPGYLVSTSVITFDASVGFTTSSPFSGVVKVVGEIGGGVLTEVVPALSGPLAIVLSLLIAMAGAVFAVSRRRARTTSG